MVHESLESYPTTNMLFTFGTVTTGEIYVWYSGNWRDLCSLQLQLERFMFGIVATGEIYVLYSDNWRDLCLVQ